MFFLSADKDNWTVLFSTGEHTIHVSDKHSAGNSVGLLGGTGGCSISTPWLIIDKEVSKTVSPVMNVSDGKEIPFF